MIVPSEYARLKAQKELILAKERAAIIQEGANIDNESVAKHSTRVSDFLLPDMDRRKILAIGPPCLICGYILGHPKWCAEK